MSWAAERRTERQEDIAYCLMGIFDVNMPLIYGEGMKAFIRLQEEILKASEDHSLFAWSVKDTNPDIEHLLETAIVDGGMLALHPAFFKDSSDCVPLRSPHSEMTSTPRGIRIEARLADGSQDDPNPLLSLYCIALTRPNQVLCVRLQRDTYRYRRFSPRSLEYVKVRDWPASRIHSILLHRSGRGVGINREYLGSISVDGQNQGVRPIGLSIFVKVDQSKFGAPSSGAYLNDLAWRSTEMYFYWDLSLNPHTCLLPEPDALRYVLLGFEDRTTKITVFVLFRLSASGPALVLCHHPLKVHSTFEDYREQVRKMILSDFKTHSGELGIMLSPDQNHEHNLRDSRVLTKSSQHRAVTYQNEHGQPSLEISITRIASMGRVAYELKILRISELINLHYAPPELPAETIKRDHCSRLARWLVKNARKRNRLIDLSVSHGHLLCSCCFGNDHNAIRSIVNPEIDQVDETKDFEFMEIAYTAASERRWDFWSHYPQAALTTSSSGSTCSLASSVGNVISLTSESESMGADVQMSGPRLSDGTLLVLIDKDHSIPFHNPHPATVEDSPSAS